MKNTNDQKLHILLADDDYDDFLLFTEAIEVSEMPITFSRAENGNHLFEVLEAEGKPDMLFLDVNMPYKNGIECLQEIRAREEYKNLPIIIYSTTSYKVNIDACYQQGANLYVIKPNSFDNILKMIKMVCSKEWLSKHGKPTPEFFILSNFE